MGLGWPQTRDLGTQFLPKDRGLISIAKGARHPVWRGGCGRRLSQPERVNLREHARTSSPGLSKSFLLPFPLNPEMCHPSFSSKRYPCIIPPSYIFFCLCLILPFSYYEHASNSKSLFDAFLAKKNVSTYIFLIILPLLWYPPEVPTLYFIRFLFYYLFPFHIFFQGNLIHL